MPLVFGDFLFCEKGDEQMLTSWLSTDEATLSRRPFFFCGKTVRSMLLNEVMVGEGVMLNLSP